ncbi:Thiol-disulfide oxidoreductase ResA [Rubripirellula tenax]|uniref:Thiol-disulfide oxidoreductase ResA n=1 Tax=Rubripirellula tenax TaxID=2528015 RepID=A0A5C6FDA0_9BACT|nr:TlpA disulfide reductase family protein [Rubripirellula tenax]TWU59395.1 Thiol-disulfide oxidoreductase ResA [Rubripirellula tenax]
MIRSLFSLAVLISAIQGIPQRVALGQDEKPGLRLPSDPRAWINSSPISVDAMRGKAIVLYFFEEGCPRCREKWPDILAAAQANQKEPVMLIAVNSGSSPEQVARYVKQQRIHVPVIMDVDRSLERMAGVNEVSLQNIWQARVIDPDGKVRRADGGDIPGTLQAASAGASWNVDPSDIPSEVMDTWRQVEFGDYASASKMVTRLTRDRRPAAKAAGEKLMSYVQQKIDTLAADAKQAEQSEDPWHAFQVYETLKGQFAGYSLPESVEQNWSKLKNDESVQTQLDAMKLWQIAQKSIQSGRTTPARVNAMMEKIIEKYPGTEAATSAQEVLGPAVPEGF